VFEIAPIVEAVDARAERDALDPDVALLQALVSLRFAPTHPHHDPRTGESRVLGRGLDAGRHVELGEDAAKTTVDGEPGRAQPVRNLGVREALGNEGRDFSLRRGQRIPPVAVVATPLGAPHRGLHRAARDALVDERPYGAEDCIVVPEEVGVLLAGQLDVRRVGDVFGEIPAVFDGGAGIISSMNYERRNSELGKQ
jgi:hypothetical protein